LNDEQLLACIEECDYNGDGVVIILFFKEMRRLIIMSCYN
jgi:hypothetical protein